MTQALTSITQQQDYERGYNESLKFGPTYKVHLFIENDSINMIFDRYNLVELLAKLYEQIGIIDRQDTGFSVFEDEKNLIITLLGEHCSIQCSDSDKERTISDIERVIYDVQGLYKTKQQLKIFSKQRETETEDQSTSQKQKKNLWLKTCTDLRGPVDENDKYKKNDSLGSYFNLMSQTTVDEEIEPNELNNESNYFLIDEIKNEIKEAKRSYIVLYNTIYEAVLLLEKDRKLYQIAKEFTDFKIVSDYNDLTEGTYNSMNEYFVKHMYCTEDMLMKKLEAFENLYEIDKSCPYEEEKRLILFHIETNYEISDDIGKRIKISALLEEVHRDLRIKDANLKYRFASILAEIGLKKKRYSDGMYIYGIETKANKKINVKSIQTIEDIIQTRTVDLERTKQSI